MSTASLTCFVLFVVYFIFRYSLFNPLLFPLLLLLLLLLLFLLLLLSPECSSEDHRLQPVSPELPVGADHAHSVSRDHVSIYTDHRTLT